MTIFDSPDGSLRLNLQQGTVHLDLEKLLIGLGLDLNNLAPGTELLPYITKALTTQLLPGVNVLLTKLINQITDSMKTLQIVLLNSIMLPVGPVLVALGPTINGLIARVNDVLSGLNTDVITPLAKALTDVVSLKVNVQEFTATTMAAGTVQAKAPAGTFTERALRVGLLPKNAPPLAVVDLASASAGPNAGPTVRSSRVWVRLVRSSRVWVRLVRSSRVTVRAALAVPVVRGCRVDRAPRVRVDRAA